jgi:hypothetical protein
MLFATQLAHAHRCVHDRLVQETGGLLAATQGNQSYASDHVDETGRRYGRGSARKARRLASGGTFSPLRVRTEFVDLAGPNRDPNVSNDLARLVTEDLVPEAIRR